MNTADYRDAPSGIGPMAYEWRDKPHRLLYDLCTQIDVRDAKLKAVGEGLDLLLFAWKNASDPEHGGGIGYQDIVNVKEIIGWH